MAAVTLKQNKLLTKTDLMFDKVFVPPRIVQRCFTTFRTTSVTIPAICHSVLESLREIEIYKGSEFGLLDVKTNGNRKCLLQMNLVICHPSSSLIKLHIIVYN